MNAPGRVRILHLVPHFKGNYPLFMSLVTGLDPQRYESVICYFDRQTDRPDALSERGYPVFHLFDQGARRPSYRPEVLIRLRRFLREHPADLIHAQRYSAAMHASLATLGVCRAPILFTVHATSRFRRTRRKLAGLWLTRRLARMITVSESVRQDVLATAWGISPAKVVTVQNGIDPRPFMEVDAAPGEARASLGLPREGFLIGALGRLDPKKAHRHLIEAFSVLARSEVDAYLVIAGKGRLESELKTQAASLGLEDRVLLMGHTSEAPRLLRALDLFALSSLAEGLPLALLEAMAAGLPVVSTRAAGVGETAEGVEGCILVEPGDVEGLAAGFAAMYRKTPEERRRLGAANRQRVLQHFTVERMVRETAAVYEAVLRERGRP